MLTNWIVALVVCKHFLRGVIIGLGIFRLSSFSDVKYRKMLGALTPAETPSYPIRFCGIPGYEGRKNDVVYCHPAVQTEKQTTVVFFGGDIQVGIF